MGSQFLLQNVKITMQVTEHHGLSGCRELLKKALLLTSILMMNQALAAHRLGGDEKFITCLGNDANGQNSLK